MVRRISGGAARPCTDVLAASTRTGRVRRTDRAGDSSPWGLPYGQRSQGSAAPSERTRKSKIPVSASSHAPGWPGARRRRHRPPSQELAKALWELRDVTTLQRHDSYIPRTSAKALSGELRVGAPSSVARAARCWSSMGSSWRTIDLPIGVASSGTHAKRGWITYWANNGFNVLHTRRCAPAFTSLTGPPIGRRSSGISVPPVTEDIGVLYRRSPLTVRIGSEMARAFQQ